MPARRRVAGPPLAGAGSDDDRARRLGRLFRLGLTQPKAAFTIALKESDEGRGSSEGAEASPAVLIVGSASGASLLLLWLKVKALFELTDTTCDFRWSYLIFSLVLGAGLAVPAQLLWGPAGSFVVRLLGGDVQGRRLRLAWSGAAVPQMVALILLLPVDLLLVGTSAFTTQPVSDPLLSAWRGGSVALGIGLALWSLWLFVRGVEAASSVSVGRAVLAAAVGAACLALVVGVFIFGAMATGGAGCPTRPG